MQENSIIDEEARAASLERIQDNLIKAMLEPPKRLENKEVGNCQQTENKTSQGDCAVSSVLF